MRIGSLFAGVGGLERGLELAGMGEVVWQVEREPYCQRVLAKHWPHATRYDDVCKIHGRGMLGNAKGSEGHVEVADVDVIVGGFP